MHLFLSGLQNRASKQTCLIILWYMILHCDAAWPSPLAADPLSFLNCAFQIGNRSPSSNLLLCAGLRAGQHTNIIWWHHSFTLLSQFRSYLSVAPPSIHPFTANHLICIATTKFCDHPMLVLLTFLTPPHSLLRLFSTLLILCLDISHLSSFFA